VASLHVVSRQHPGMFEHMAGVILAWMDDNAQQEPESWPPEVHQLVEVSSVPAHSSPPPSLLFLFLMYGKVGCHILDPSLT